MSSKKYKKTYARVDVLPREEPNEQYFYVALTNFKSARQAQILLPQHNSGHFFITLGIVPELEKPPLPLSGIGKIITNHPGEDNFQGSMPTARHYVAGFLDIFKTFEASIEDEDFPYDWQHQTNYVDYKKVMERDKKDEKPKGVSSSEETASKNIKKWKLGYDAYLLTAEEYKKIVSFLRQRYKEQRIGGQATSMQHTVNVADWIEEENCLRHTHFSSTFKVIIDTILASQRAYRSYSFNKDTPRNDNLNLLFILTEAGHINGLEDYKQCLLFLYLQIHFLTLAKISSEVSPYSQVSFSDDLSYVKKTITETAEPLFNQLAEVLGDLNAADTLKNLDSLREALKDEWTTATDLAKQCDTFHHELLRLSQEASPRHHFIRQTLTVPKVCNNVEKMTFSYRDDSCYGWALDFMKKQVPGFNSTHYDDHFYAELPQVLTHQAGVISDPFVFTPRRLDSVLQNDQNHCHYLAAQILYTHLWPKPRSQEVYETWFPVYQALEREIRFKSGKTKTLKSIHAILEQYAAEKKDLPGINLSLYSSLLKLADQEDSLRWYYSIRETLLSKLAGKSIEGIQDFIDAGDQLALQEPEKLVMVIRVFENLSNLCDDSFNTSYAIEVEEALNEVRYKTSLWHLFELGTCSVLVGITAAAAIATFVMIPPVAVTCLAASAVLALHVAVKTVNVIKENLADLRTHEDNFFTEASKVNRDLVLGLA